MSFAYADFVLLQAHSTKARRRPLCRKRQPLVGLARSNLGSYVGRGLALRRQRRRREAKNVACILCFVQADVVTVAEVVGILKMA
jgi:hypothetical protein